MHTINRAGKRCLFPEGCLKMYRMASLICFAMAAFLFSACSLSLPVDKAFSGDLEPEEETKVIIGYCQSCHLHRDFKADEHLAKAPGYYSKEPYQSTRSCSVCHEIERNFWNDILRFTHIPDGRIVNE